MSHQEDRIHIAAAAANVGFHRRHHFGGNPFSSVGPSVQYLVVSFDVGDDTAVVELLVFENGFLGFADNLRFRIRSHEIVSRERQTTSRTFSETELVHVVEQLNGGAATKNLVAVGNHHRQFARSERDIVEVHAIGQHHIEHDATACSFHDIHFFASIVLGSYDTPRW